MFGFAILCAAIVATGLSVARLLYRRFEPEEPAPIELHVAGAAIGLAVWLGVNWILAIAHALTRRNLLIAAALFVIAGCTAIRRPRRISVDPWMGIAALAIVAWSLFILWRGAIVPPASHDALAYHLPKAVMIMRAASHGPFDWPDARIATYPSNYELLLADVLILAGNDRLTEWIGTASYLLFLALVALYSRRWWGPGLHVTASVLAAAGVPLLLLHSGHDKNDLLTGTLAAGALYWSAKWCARRGIVPAVLAIVCGVTAIGTKMNAATIVLGVAPFGIFALIRKPARLRLVMASIAFALIVLLLCGGWIFVQNAGHAEGRDANQAGMPTPHYGEWRNLIDIPYLLMRVSLGFDAVIPWTGERWWWSAYDLYGSHYGPLIGGAMLLLPFCIWRYARAGDEDLRRERMIATIAALIAFAVLLPIVQYPRSAAKSTLRYVIFCLPIVLGWTVAPMMRSLVDSGRRTIAHLGIAVILVLSIQQAVQIALFDLLVPIEHVRWCVAHPGTRRIHWTPNRAGSVVDTLAGPNNTIAMYGVSDIWVYPAYGRSLSRRVLFANDPDRIPAAAQWVAIDYVPHELGAPTAKETRFYRELLRDPRYRLVYRNERFNQAVFRRISA